MLGSFCVAAVHLPLRDAAAGPSACDDLGVNCHHPPQGGGPAPGPPDPNWRREKAAAEERQREEAARREKFASELMEGKAALDSDNPWAAAYHCGKALKLEPADAASRSCVEQARTALADQATAEAINAMMAGFDGDVRSRQARAQADAAADTRVAHSIDDLVSGTRAEARRDSDTAQSIDGLVAHARAEAARPPSVRFDESWTSREEQRAIEQMVEGLRDSRFRSWVKTSILFHRVSRGLNDSRVTATPGGVITVYDPFWAPSANIAQGDAPFDAAAQTSLITFELAKAFWFEKVVPGAPEDEPRRKVAFEALLERHRETIQAMRYASFKVRGGREEGANLADLELADGDYQSHFALACRVAVLDVALPSSPPAAYAKDPTTWARIQSDRATARADISAYLAELWTNGP